MITLYPQARFTFRWLPLLALLTSGLAAAGEPKTELLWPDGAPGSKGAEAKDKPTLIIYLPDKPSGVGIVICPGGGYGGLAIDHEGHQIARWVKTRRRSWSPAYRTKNK